MGTQRAAKLNWLQHHLPEGLLVDAAWLEEQGFSTALRSKYLRHGWLEQLARAVYRRPPAWLQKPGDEKHLLWQSVVISLQMLLDRPVVVGGRSALEQQGFAHYLALSGPRELHLYGNEALPGWAPKLKLDARLVFHSSRTLFKEGMACGSLPAVPDRELAQRGFIRQPWGQQEWPLVMSAPERAILELLNELPQRETFHQADMLVEGLRNLRPRSLQRLLADCRSIKVKRLFLWFAERHGHAWLKKLDRSGIDLGCGKRMLVRGGRLDTKYNITVPGDLDARA
ncbi:MAG: type IV toxin-antitoxin system AbiEi family antitoxin domain-containing protein [Bryobacteraceae bacterium]